MQQEIEKKAKDMYPDNMGGLDQSSVERYRAGYEKGYIDCHKQHLTGSAVWVKASEFKTHNPVYRPYRKPCLEDEGEYDYGEIYVTEDDSRIYLDVDNECNYEHQSDERWKDYEILDESNEQPAEQKEWDSERMIGRVKDRFKELEAKQWDWRSFYNGWLEGRADMLQQIRGWGKYEQKENEAVDNCLIDRIKDFNLSDVDAPVFTHTKEFEAHFSYIKGKLMDVISNQQNRNNTK